MTPTRIRLWKLAVPVAVGLLLLGGCNGGDDDAASDDPAATTSTTAATEATGTRGVTTTTGDITETVESPSQPTLASVPIDQPVDVDGIARVELVSIDRVDAEARLPGEVAGPALAVGVRITNTGSTPIDAGAVTVNLSDANAQASAPLTTPPAAPLQGALQPDESVEGVYLFEFGDGRSEPVTIEVSPAVAAPVAVFVGPIS